MPKGLEKGVKMLRFISLAFVLLLCTAPNFFATQLFVVESINDDIIKFESLATTETNEHAQVIYCKKKTFPQAREGQIVFIQLAGSHILKLQTDDNVTEERQIVIGRLLEKLENNSKN